ncbi:MAG: hypothetical protein Q7U02_07010 [Desulfosalsimonadaceae bacterium]|nr:hypothetical protein [Desulfosalsimonadaceae bacterium]
MISAYLSQKAEREALGIPPKPLTADQTAALVELLCWPEGADTALLLNLITHRVPARMYWSGVLPAAPRDRCSAESR